MASGPLHPSLPSPQSGWVLVVTRATPGAVEAESSPHCHGERHRQGFGRHGAQLCPYFTAVAQETWGSCVVCCPFVWTKPEAWPFTVCEAGVREARRRGAGRQKGSSKSHSGFKKKKKIICFQKKKGHHITETQHQLPRDGKEWQEPRGRGFLQQPSPPPPSGASLINGCWGAPAAAAPAPHSRSQRDETCPNGDCRLLEATHSRSSPSNLLIKQKLGAVGRLLGTCLPAAPWRRRPSRGFGRPRFATPCCQTSPQGRLHPPPWCWGQDLGA